MSLQLRMKHTSGLCQWNQCNGIGKFSKGFYFLPKGFHIQFLNLTICPCSDTHAHLCSVQKFMYTTVESNISCLALYAKTYFVAEWREILWRLCYGSHEIIRAWVGFPTFNRSFHTEFDFSSTVMRILLTN